MMHRIRLLAVSAFLLLRGGWAQAQNQPVSREEMIQSIEKQIQQRVTTAENAAKEQQQATVQMQEMARRETEELKKASPVDLALRNVSQIATLSFDPGDCVVVEGDSFSTHLMLRSQFQKAFDEMDILIAFDPLYLRPLSVHDNELRPLADGAPDFSVDEAKGRIRYRVVLDEPLTFFSQKLLSVVWKAVHPADSTGIELRLPEARSSVRLGSRDILAGDLLPRGALVSLGVSILPRQLDFKRRFLESREAAAEAGQERSGSNATLRMEGPSVPLKPGVEFTARVMLRNPGKSFFDGVTLSIAYPADSVEILDWDQGNWIRRGINIHDFPAHDAFPFDFHIANEVAPDAGRILYQMGSSRRPLAAEGMVAEIRARALRPLSISDFRLLREAEDDNPPTDVTYMGASILAPAPYPAPASIRHSSGSRP